MLGTAELLSIADSLGTLGAHEFGLSPAECVSLSMTVRMIAARIDAVMELARLTVPPEGVR